MKNKFVPLLSLLTLSLSGCGVIDTPTSVTPPSSTDPTSSSSVPDTSISVSSSTTTGNSNTSTSQKPDVIDESFIDYELNTDKIQDNQFPIGIYGDYMEFTDDSTEDLSDTFSKLSKKVKGKENGIFQTNYEQGLLNLFDYTKKIKIAINISSDELRDIQRDYETGNDETYRMCDLDIYIDNIHFHYLQVGIRQKGNTSRGSIYNDDPQFINLRHYKLSFEETFDDEYRETKAKWFDEDAYEYRADRKFFGEDKINIRWNRNYDTTYIREAYVNNMALSFGVLAARSNVTNVVMNIDGEEHNLGVYTLLEQYDKGFIKRNFVKDARDGDLYKLSWGNGTPATFEEYTADNIGVENLVKRSKNNFEKRLYTYTLKTNKDTSDFSVMKNFIKNLCSQRGATMYDFMSENSDLDNFVSFAALSYLFGDPDDLRGNYNNTYVYFTKNTNKAVFMPTDLDRPFGATGGAGSNPTGHHAALNKPFDYHTGYGTYDGGTRSELFNKAIFSSNSTQIRELYLNKINTIIESGWMSIDKYQSMYDYAYNFYSDVVEISSNVNGWYVEFSISESTDIYGDNNLDVETYIDYKIFSAGND